MRAVIVCLALGACVPAVPLTGVSEEFVVIARPGEPLHAFRSADDRAVNLKGRVLMAGFDGSTLRSETGFEPPFIISGGPEPFPETAGSYIVWEDGVSEVLTERTPDFEGQYFPAFDPTGCWAQRGCWRLDDEDKVCDLGCGPNVATPEPPEPVRDPAPPELFMGCGGAPVDSLEAEIAAASTVIYVDSDSHPRGAEALTADGVELRGCDGAELGPLILTGTVTIVGATLSQIDVAESAVVRLEDTVVESGSASDVHAVRMRRVQWTGTVDARHVDAEDAAVFGVLYAHDSARLVRTALRGTSEGGAGVLQTVGTTTLTDVSVAADATTNMGTAAAHVFGEVSISRLRVRGDQDGLTLAGWGRMEDLEITDVGLDALEIRAEGRELVELRRARLASRGGQGLIIERHPNLIAESLDVDTVADTAVVVRGPPVGRGPVHISNSLLEGVEGIRAGQLASDQQMRLERSRIVIQPDDNGGGIGIVVVGARFEVVDVRVELGETNREQTSTAGIAAPTAMSATFDRVEIVGTHFGIAGFDTTQADIYGIVMTDVVAFTAIDATGF